MKSLKLNLFHLDLETFNTLDLKKVGLDVYARHPSCEITMAAWCLDDSPVYQSDEEHKFLSVIRQAANDPDVQFVAFNAQFERVILREVAGIDIPPERWICSMVWAFSLGFSGGLADIGKQLGLPQEKQKLEEGRKLVLKFCKPAPKNHNVERYTKQNSPEEWKRFCQYNSQDVVAEREIMMLLKPYPMTEEEWQTYWVDQRINDTGFPVDLHLVDQAIKVYHAEKKRLAVALGNHTGLSNPNSGPQLMKWLKDYGYEFSNLQADTIKKTLAAWNPWDSPVVRKALEWKQQLARTAGSKWETFKRATDKDTGRFRYAFQFNGAQRTCRWAGRTIQPHNLHRSPEDQDEKIRSLLSGDNEWVTLMHGNTMDTVASCIRAGIRAPKGKKLVVCDLASIESRWLGWMSGCSRINGLFAEGKDTYRDFASHWFGMPYDEVTKPLRTMAKPPELGCGYMLGADGLVRYADDMGVEIKKEESKQAVKLWRELNFEVPAMWDWLKQAVESVVTIGDTWVGYTVRIFRDDNFLFIELPSGRRLGYYQPLILPRIIKIVDSETGEERKWETTSLTYMGKNQYTHQWERITSHPGKVTENIDQGGSRDILRDGIKKAFYEPILEVVGHVHDEIVCLADEAVAKTALEYLTAIMRADNPWAPGLLLGAEGYIADHYRKE